MVVPAPLSLLRCLVVEKVVVFLYTTFCSCLTNEKKRGSQGGGTPVVG